MKLPNIVHIRIAVVSAMFIAALGCGGGSGGDGNGITTQALSKNACSDLGLSAINPLILDGTACTGLSQSPVVRVLLQDQGGKTEALCTGTMLTTTKVITAGHCFVSHPAQVKIGYGDSSNLQTVLVSRVNIHPHFELKSTEIENDVAILTLVSAAPLPTLPIVLSKVTEAGNIASIFGYGTDASSLLDGAVLRSGQVEISSVSESTVNSVYDGNGSNTCQGDSGGPLLRRAKQKFGIIGLTSTGTRNDCQIGDLTTYTNLQSQHILDFIMSVAPETGLL